MPAKKIRPPPIVKVQLCQCPPEWAEKIEALDRCKALKTEISLRFVGMRMSKLGFMDPDNPGQIEMACGEAWAMYLERFARIKKEKYAETARRTIEERAEREAYWAETQAKRELEQRIRKLKADGYMSKKISRREEIKWVDNRLGVEDVKPEDAPTEWCYNSWLDYHGSEEKRHVFRTTFSSKVIESDKTADAANRKVAKSDKTLEMLDSILEEHIQQQGVE